MIDIKHMRPTKLLWVDLEMTGLDPEQHVIVEVAAKITDFDFKPFGEYTAVIHQPDDVLDHATAWNKEHHGGADGLYARSRASTVSERDAIQALVKLIKETFGEELAVLAGNSIHQDRRFIRAWWPEVEALLHYRMLDVSSWKVWMQGKYGLEFEKRESHLADDDIQVSITELQFYLDWFRQQHAQ